MCADFRFYTGIINFKKWWCRRDKPYSVCAQPRVGTAITLCLDEHRVPLSLQLRSRLFPLSGPQALFPLVIGQGAHWMLGLCGRTRLRACWARALSAAGPGTFLGTLSLQPLHRIVCALCGLFSWFRNSLTPSPHGSGAEMAMFL